MKKKTNTSQIPNSGFDNLISSHTAALQENSDMIVRMLKELSKKQLSASNKKEIQFIKKELNRLNKEIDNLGEY